MLTEGAIATDEFATLVGEIPHDQMLDLRLMALAADWREIQGRKYDTAEANFWEPCQRAFFIRIPPGGSIPRHHDVFIPGITHHLIVRSNFQSLNGWIDTQGKERTIHLAEGKRYTVSREPLHWATNNGHTDRIHLLVEYGQ